MQMRCPSCGYRYLNDASFCIVCGAALRPIAHEPSARPTGATGPTIRLGQQFSLPAGAASAPARAADRTVAQTSPWRGASKPLIALLFAVVFMIGLAEYLTSRGRARDAGVGRPDVAAGHRPGRAMGAAAHPGLVRAPAALVSP